jgi:hypothetical protein
LTTVSPSQKTESSTTTVFANESKEESEEEWSDMGLDDDASLGYPSDDDDARPSCKLGETSMGERAAERKQVFIVDLSTGFTLPFPGHTGTVFSFR